MRNVCFSYVLYSTKLAALKKFLVTVSIKVCQKNTYYQKMLVYYINVYISFSIINIRELFRIAIYSFIPMRYKLENLEVHVLNIPMFLIIARKMLCSRISNDREKCMY